MNLIRKQWEVKDEDSGVPRRAFYRATSGDFHVTVSCDWRKKEALVSIQKEREYGGLVTLRKADFDLPVSLTEEEAHAIAEAYWREHGREVA